METATTLLAVFIGIAALALLLQGLALFGLARSLRSLSTRLDGYGSQLIRNVEAISDKADSLLVTATSVADRIMVLQENLSTTASIVQKRVVDLDQFLDEATSSARLQVVRIQDMVETTSRRVEDTVGTLQKGVLAPVTEVHAVLAGIRVGLKYLFRRKKHPSRSPQDEEMFI